MTDCFDAVVFFWDLPEKRTEQFRNQPHLREHAEMPPGYFTRDLGGGTASLAIGAASA
ncbi:hypothetical protein AMC78_CH00186 [Rhizobium phaseoli]|uniref:hypothetical protein n=1 Tax=Rhizobium phaseoli TaxID=396 RepID=UPI0007F14505|nr:hypothetical protein [Rhizobium phaseoli]ANM02343.1 hypothetical protein AMC78_CH00186 [Rhizobium phaseoli]